MSEILNNAQTESVENRPDNFIQELIEQDLAEGENPKQLKPDFRPNQTGTCILAMLKHCGLILAQLKNMEAAVIYGLTIPIQLKKMKSLLMRLWKISIGWVMSGISFVMDRRILMSVMRLPLN